MKILHTADWHIGELTGPVINGQNARQLDTLRCIDNLIDQAQAAQIDVVLIAGDLFDKSKLWSDTMLGQIDLAADRLRRLAAIAPTVLLFGTANHDSLKAFKNIQAMQIPNLHIATAPGIIKIGDLQVACIPGFDKGYFRAQMPGMAAEQENMLCSKMLGDIVLGLSAQLDPEKPSVLMAHYTVIGCQLDNGEHVFMQSDMVLPKEALLASRFDLVCLGHIHRAQVVEYCGRPTYYSGPPNGLTFNEEGQQKGFWLHDLTPQWPQAGFAVIQSLFNETPARQFVTEEWEETFVQGFVDGHGGPGSGFADAIVRLRYRCGPELEKQLNRKAVEKALYDAGAFYVAEVMPAKVVEILQKDNLAETAGPLENLSEWLQQQKCPDEEVAVLMELAMPLVAEVSAKMPTGKLSGVFRPKQLEVKNYRSYREESFSFDQICFAIVNGPNGVGKSAFFGDAISDCLFEKTRECGEARGSGDLTGWIANIPDAKSGAITFEFAMGETDWRVTRTRTKSGKMTLALAELIDGQWADRSTDRAVDTQEKIIALLGMDAMTFRSCALIMQDAYGLFLEANKEDRMTVLGNLLGLSVYEKLLALAKEQVTNANREANRIKDKLAELDVRLQAEPELANEHANTEILIAAITEELAGKEVDLNQTQDELQKLKTRAQKNQELQQRISALQTEREAKLREWEAEQRRKIGAEEILREETAIQAAGQDYRAAMEQVNTLRARKPELARLTSIGETAQMDLSSNKDALRKVNEEISVVSRELSQKTDLEQSAAEYNRLMAELPAWNTRRDEHNDLAMKQQIVQGKLSEAQRVHQSSNELLTAKIKILSAKAAMLGDSNCIDSDNAQCNFLKDAQRAKVNLPETEAELTGLSTLEIEKYQQELDDLQLKIVALKYEPEQHKRLETQVAQLRPKAEKVAMLAGKSDLLAKLEEQKAGIVLQQATLIQALEKNQEDQRALGDELAPLKDLEVRLPALEKQAEREKELPAARQALELAKERMTVIACEIATRDDQICNLKVERGDWQAIDKEIAAARDIGEVIKKDIASIQRRQNEAHAQKGSLVAKLEALAADAAEKRQLDAAMQPLAQMAIRFAKLAEAFGEDGIPFAVIRSVVPELSAMANEILGQMTGGKMTLEMRTERVQKSNKKEVNALEIWITDYVRGSLPYKSRSGGQKVKAALSVAFALVDVKSRRAGIQLGMLFVDEPSFLDADGTDAYCDALETLVTRYESMKVIAISHDERMKARFPQVITVEDMGEGGSKVHFVG